MEIYKNRNIVLSGLTAGSVLLAGCQATPTKEVNPTSTPSPATSTVDSGLQATFEAFKSQGTITVLEQQLTAQAVKPTETPDYPATIAALQAQPKAQAEMPTAAAKQEAGNGLVDPVLHHADSQPPENGVGSFDVGVKEGQIGIAFGIHIGWPKGGLDAGGGSCNLVILKPGWYENLQVQDGRYEVYDVPSSDYAGWVKVLGQQRADEQAKDYGCPAKTFSEIPQWESTIPSPP